jgi:hypothetical protein
MYGKEKYPINKFEKVLQVSRGKDAFKEFEVFNKFSLKKKASHAVLLSFKGAFLIF